MNTTTWYWAHDVKRLQNDAVDELHCFAHSMKNSSIMPSPFYLESITHVKTKDAIVHHADDILHRDAYHDEGNQNETF